MSSPSKVPITEHPAITQWLTTRATDSASTITLVIGYIMGITGAQHLTPANFFAFTACQILYGVILCRLLINIHLEGRQLALCLGVLSALTIASGMFLVTGIDFDWLLYFVMISIYFSRLSPRTAIILSVLLYISAPLSLSIISNGKTLWNGWITFIAGFGFVAAFSISNSLLNIERKRTRILLNQLEESNRDLEVAHTQLQKYANEVEELTVVRERTRLAREIHDTLGHYLTILTIQLETISKLQERDPARAIIEVTEARRVAAQSMQEVRNAVAALRPTSIATLSLTEAILQLSNEFRVVAPDTDLTLDLDTQLPPLIPDLQLALYRATQETLTNVRKHAHATKVLVRLRYEDEVLELVVLDNGNGQTTKDTTQHTRGFGLLGLRERIELLDGQVTYGPIEPTGYRVTIHVHISPGNAIKTSDLVEKSYDTMHPCTDC